MVSADGSLESFIQEAQKAGFVPQKSGNLYHIMSQDGSCNYGLASMHDISSGIKFSRPTFQPSENGPHNHREQLVRIAKQSEVRVSYQTEDDACLGQSVLE